MASGLARGLGTEPIMLRLVFVALTIASGSGPLLYAIAWLALPREPEGTPPPPPPRHGTRQSVAVALLAIGGILLLRAIGLWLPEGLLWPLILGCAGLAVLWREAGGPDQAPITRVAVRLASGDTGDRRAALIRVAVGVALVLGGSATFLAANHAFAETRAALTAVVGVLGGLALIFGPWWWRLVQDLAAERRQRVRSDERAEVAAHLHDSVLQTLALIQRQADDPKAVVTLARAQERELRGWLFGAGKPAPDGRFGPAIEAMGDEVELLHGVPVDTVTVGDCPLDPRLAALVAAAREATVNAAKWSEAPAVSVYAEVEDHRVAVFVRDRGVGFDPAAVGRDRKGIAESITGRMSRNGGAAFVRSSPGDGTEVELTIPRAAP